MGNIMSRIKAIDDTEFRPLTSVAEAHKLIQCNRKTYVLTKDGKVHTDSTVGGKVCFINGCADDVAALVAFGLVTKAEAKVHRAIDRQQSKLREKRDEAGRFQRMAERIGVPLDRKQLAALAVIGNPERLKLRDLHKQAEHLNGKRSLTAA